MTLFKTLKHRLESRTRGRASLGVPSPATGWQILLAVFLVSEIIFLSTVIFVSYRFERRRSTVRPPAENAGNAPTINREQLRDLLDYFEGKRTTHEALHREPPALVDPSVKSWYGEDDAKAR